MLLSSFDDSWWNSRLFTSFLSIKFRSIVDVGVHVNYYFCAADLNGVLYYDKWQPTNLFVWLTHTKTKYSTDDYSKRFTVNGLEIDLTELETFEKHLTDKRKSKPNVSINSSPDELDIYLDRLAIDINARDTANNANDASFVPMPSTSMQHDDTVAAESSMADDIVANEPMVTSLVALTMPKTSLPLLLYGLMSILVYINSVYYSKRHSDHHWITTFSDPFSFSISIF